VVRGGNQDAYVYTSSDAGSTWTKQQGPDLQWISVASSADGSKLVAAVFDGQVYTSVDSGVSWTARAVSGSTQLWVSVASSADGSTLVAAPETSQLYISTASTTPGTGSISGAQSDAIELQYVGDGLFDVVSHEGNLTIE
jgi:hypothetical protein